jgi:predicted amidophosphoribosyltransferase
LETGYQLEWPFPADETPVEHGVRVISVKEVSIKSAASVSSPIHFSEFSVSESANKQPSKREALGTDESMSYIALHEIDDFILGGSDDEIDQFISLYSMYKFGSRDAIAYFARELVKKIVKSIGSHIETHRSDWVVVTSQFNNMPSASHSVSIEVAKLLCLPFITPQVKQKDAQDVSYASLTQKEQRLVSRRSVGVFLDKRDAQLVKGKKVLLIDDLINSGATVDNLVDILKKDYEVSHINIFVIVRLKSNDLSLESKMNTHMLRTNQVDAIVSILSDLILR